MSRLRINSKRRPSNRIMGTVLRGYSPVPRGVCIERFVCSAGTVATVRLDLSFLSASASSCCVAERSTVRRLPAVVAVVGNMSDAFDVVAAVVATIVETAADVECEADDVNAPLLRNTKIDCDLLSSRLSVCSSIGVPSVLPFLAIRCWTIMEPSGRHVPVTVLFFALVDCTSTGAPTWCWWCGCCCCCWSCCSDSKPFFSTIVPPPVTMPLGCSSIRPSEVADDLAAVLKRVCCSNSGLSSSLSKLSSSWLFCSTIWPFSLRDPRTRMMLPPCAVCRLICCGWWTVCCCSCCCWWWWEAPAADVMVVVRAAFVADDDEATACWINLVDGVMGIIMWLVSRSSVCGRNERDGTVIVFTVVTAATVDPDDDTEMVLVAPVVWPARATRCEAIVAVGADDDVDWRLTTCRTGDAVTLLGGLDWILASVEPVACGSVLSVTLGLPIEMM